MVTVTRLGMVVLALAVVAASTVVSADTESVRALYERGALNEAEAAAVAELEALESSGADPLAIADLLDLLVDIRRSNDRDAAAVAPAERAVAIRSGSIEPDRARLAASMVRLGSELAEVGEHERSIAVLTEACELADGALEPDDPERARCLNRLARAHLLDADVDAVSAAAREALALLEACGRGDSADAAVSLHHLGAAAGRRDDLDEALRLLERALAIRERQLGPDDVSLVAPLSQLAVVVRRRGDPDRAFALFHRALGLLEASGRGSSQNAAGVLNSLGLLERERGDYLAARRHLERAIELWEANGGPDQFSVAGGLSNLARVLTETGDLRGAVAMLERALAIFERLGGPDHPNVVRCLANMGGLLLEAGDPEAAVPVLERGLALGERLFEADSTRLAPALANLGQARREAGRPGAEEALRRAIAIFEGHLGPDHLELASPLYNLATYHAAQGRVELARAELERAVEIRSAALGPEHPNTANLQIGLARVAARQGDLVGAFDLALEVERIGREHLSLTARGLSAREAMLYDEARARGLDLALTLLVADLTRNDARVRAGWNALIRSRGLVLEEMAERTRLRGLGEGRLEGLAREVAAAAGELARARVEEARGEPARDREARLEGARQRLEVAERALGEASLPFRQGRARTATGLDGALKGLPPGWALVSYARFGRHDVSRPEVAVEPSYLAFVAEGGELKPRIVRLGTAERIDSLVSEWRDAVLADRTAAGPELPSRRPGEALRRAVWDPVAQVLGAPERVLVALDSQLLLVNLAVLPAPEGGYLVERGPLIHVLADERDLAAPAVAPDPVVPRLLAVGGVDFGPLPAAGGRGFAPLPATADEVTAVTALWRRVHGEASPASAVELAGGAATEAAVKALAPGATVLHLATHGFSAGGGLEGTRGVGRLVPATAPGPPAEPAAVEEPLRLSGLALADANVGSSDEDGILTAEEVATLDLTAARWVVLSACDSGVGEVGPREGVFGLRRAFRVAGARTVVMSLWPVEDEAARGWMEAFYRSRLEGGLDAAAAAREASLEALAARRAAGRPDSPAFWGVFLAAGEYGVTFERHGAAEAVP